MVSDFPREAIRRRLRSRLRVALALLPALVMSGPSFAQITPSNPIFQQEKPGYQTSIDPSGAMIMRLRDNFGRPCINVRGFVRRDTILEGVFQHFVEATNICAKLITIKVCYFKTQSCKDIRMNSFARRVEQLGSMANVVYFQFNFTEKAK